VPRLPKLPPTPKRTLPAPSRSAVIEARAIEWAEEPRTKPTTESLALFQSLLSVFDGLTQEERGEFVELAAIWAGMKPSERRALLGLVARR
jgi:hypothetical protein